MFRNSVRTATKVAISGARHYCNKRDDGFDPLLDLGALVVGGVFAAHVIGIGASKAIDFVGKVSCPFSKSPVDGDGGDS